MSPAGMPESCWRALCNVGLGRLLDGLAVLLVRSRVLMVQFFASLCMECGCVLVTPALCAVAPKVARIQISM